MKPGYSETLDSSTYQQVLRQADAVVDKLAAGKDVSPEMVNQTRETLVDLLWVDAPASGTPSWQRLVTLYAYSKDGADRAELIGELAAAGPRAKEALTMINQFGSSSTITPEEIQSLNDHVHLPPESRLEMIADWLSEQKQRSDSPTDERIPFDPVRAYGYALLPDQKFELVPDEQKTEGDPPPDAEADLNNRELSNERRFEAVAKLGPNAVPHLAKLLRDPDPGQREFAVVALNRLGRTDVAAYEVMEVARRAETDPELRPIGEHIRRTVEGRGQEDDSRARQRAKAANIGDTWLKSAIDRCDAPSILNASAGREMLVIPMIARRLHELRAR